MLGILHHQLVQVAPNLSVPSCWQALTPEIDDIFSNSVEQVCIFQQVLLMSAVQLYNASCWCYYAGVQILGIQQAVPMFTST
mmetsp:Transcript_10148/g.16411  ORF Transcript_10148/g.16411 Transcript_10148/m.16411 type:complete len:82 (+) Transcript_10148:765-1010(+)